LYSFSRNVHNIPAGNVEKDYFSLFLDWYSARRYHKKTNILHSPEKNSAYLIQSGRYQSDETEVYTGTLIYIGIVDIPTLENYLYGHILYASL
jgi:hypothetical protein